MQTDAGGRLTPFEKIEAMRVSSALKATEADLAQAEKKAAFRRQCPGICAIGDEFRALFGDGVKILGGKEGSCTVGLQATQMRQTERC